MGDNTAIEWTDATWNPIIGCSKVGPGCDNCYAIDVVHRAMSPQHEGMTIRTPSGTDWTGEVREVPHLLDQPLRWRRPRRIFVNSLSDLFHPTVSEDYIAEVFAVMALARHHTFQVLTKRPQRMAELLSRETTGTSFSDRRWGFHDLVLDRIGNRGHSNYGEFGDDLWPLPNVWLGTSIETDRYSFRADHLRHTPAAVRWISAEPLLGPLDNLNLIDIDWLVVGGESGPGARPMHPDWARDLRDRCTAYLCPRCKGSFSIPLGHSCADHHPTRGPAFLFKQWGNWVSQSSHAVTNEMCRTAQRHPETSYTIRHDGTLENPGVLGHHAIYRMPKKAAGRELDGRTWDEYPS